MRKPAITVSELIKHLQQLPQHWPIVATWEGVFAPILPENIALDNVIKYPCVVINVEDYDWACLRMYYEKETPHGGKS